ncbi:MAG: hypothetical protein ACI4MG_04435 [Aristaeellaceae bacterium]
MIGNLTRFALICLIALPLWVLLRRPWKRRLSRDIALSLFAAYLTALLVMALRREHVRRGGVVDLPPADSCHGHTF